MKEAPLRRGLTGRWPRTAIGNALSWIVESFSDPERLRGTHAITLAAASLT
jgi:hypothetical protein